MHLSKIPIKKYYWTLIALALIVGLDWIIQAPDSRSRDLTQAIHAQGSERLKSYPYQFWVMEIKGTTAILSSPRDRTVPAMQMIAVLHPGINTRDPNNPEFIAAQKTLADIQTEAREILLKQPGIKEVRWGLDRKWLTAHHIEVPSS